MRCARHGKRISFLGDCGDERSKLQAFWILGVGCAGAGMAVGLHFAGLRGLLLGALLGGAALLITQILVNRRGSEWKLATRNGVADPVPVALRTLAVEQLQHVSKADEQIEHTEKRLAEVNAFRQTLVAVERELGEYHDLLSRKLASLEKGQENPRPVADAVADW
jgi:hypothetical protein